MKQFLTIKHEYETKMGNNERRSLRRGRRSTVRKSLRRSEDYTFRLSLTLTAGQLVSLGNGNQPFRINV